MESQTAQIVYAELNTIKETLAKLQAEITRLTVAMATDSRSLSPADFMAIVGLGASGTADISENHDRYAGDAIADEHLY